MVKREYIFILYIIIHCIYFLPITPLQKTSSILPLPTIQLPAPVTKNLFPGVQIYNSTNVTTQPTKSNVLVASYLSPPTLPSIPIPVNKTIKKQLRQAIKQPPIYTGLPQDHKKLAQENQMAPVVFAAIIAASITHFLNNTNPTPQRLKLKPHIPDKKYNTPPPIPIKTGLDHIIDQQYAQLTKIATEYEQSLQSNRFYQSGKHRIRIQSRINAIKEWQLNPQKKIKTSHVNRTFLQYSRFANSAYTTITADPIQRALHKEITSISNELVNFKKLDPKISGYLFNYATLLMEISRSYSGNNIIVQAMNAADVCWEIIEAAHTASPEVLFSKETEQIWQYYFLYSHAKLPECSVNWNQFELEKTRWYNIQKKCKRLLNGFNTFISDSHATIEEQFSKIGITLAKIAAAFDHFLLNEIYIKINLYSNLLHENASKMAQKCKERLTSLVHASKTIITDFVQYLYNQITGMVNSGVSFATNIAMNAITLYLVVGLFSTGENPIQLKTAALLSIAMKLIHASGSASTLAGSLAQTLFYALRTHPLQALIIGAALLTPVISPLIEEYRTTDGKPISATCLLT